MMNKHSENGVPFSARRLWWAAALFLLVAPGFAQAGTTVYDRLYAEFSRHPHRRAGSEALASCFQALEAELRAAGLEPRRQTFRTLVQETERLSFTYDGQPVDGVLMTDNGPAAFVLDAPISGPVIAVGSGRLQDLDGKDLDGAIAVLDTALPRFTAEHVFPRGARAVIIVGDASVDQWRLSALSFSTVSLVPRLYLDRASAMAAGLLDADGSRHGVIDGRAVLKDRDGVNLWVELPGLPGWTGELGREEVLVLSARLDTYGFTPDYSPDLRFAANAALLADTAVAMAAAGPTRRRVVVVFFGAHYAGQEGARFFYHAIDMTDDKANPSGLDVRASRYEQELNDVNAAIESASTEVIIGGRTAVARGLQRRLRRALASRVNRQRAELGHARRELNELAQRIERAEFETAGEQAALVARARELEAEIEEADVLRARWNHLREQLFKGVFKAEDAENVALYRTFAESLTASLQSRRREIKQMIADNASWIALRDVFMNRDLVSHFDFDFANDRDPWMLSMINAYRLYRHTSVDSGAFLRNLHAVSMIYYGSPDGRTPGISDQRDWPARLYRPALTPIFKPYSLSVPNQRIVPSAVGVGLGYAGFQMMTVGDSLPHDALPFATPTDLSGLRGQMAVLCRALGDSPEMSLIRVYSRENMESRYTYTFERGGLRGVNFINYAPNSTDTEGLPERSIMIMAGVPVTGVSCGISPLARTRILGNGFIYTPMISRSTAVSWPSRTIGIGYDANGAFERISFETHALRVINTPNHLFYAHGGLTMQWGYAPDSIGGDLYQPRMILAANDARHRTFANYSIGNMPIECFADRPNAVKRIGGNGEMILGSVLLDTRTVDEEAVKHAMGLGVPLDRAFLLNFDGIAQGARDAYTLNEIRLRTLRERNIVRDDLEELHAEAREHIEAAEHGRGEKAWSLARAHDVFATCIENRVYRPLRGVTEDLVQAVVVLLLLNIPFAFAMERLIFGFTNIYKQIGGFCLFFISTFLVLFFTHPAFALASAPIIIFLAFVIILLSVLTTAIMMGKIKQEIRAMQGLASTVHGVESDNSTTLSAVLIGISGMRNRPLKTFLTSVTVVLLTFTILVFASFTSQEGVVEAYLGRGLGEDRIELHRLSFLEIDPTLTESIEILYGDRFDVYRRGGVFRLPTRPGDSGTTPLLPERVIYHPGTQRSVRVNAVAGYDPGEFVRNPEFRKVSEHFATGTFAHPPLFLPTILEEELQAKPGDDLLLNGLRFTYGGPFDGDALQALATIENVKVLPPDFQTTMSNAGRPATGSAEAGLFEEMASGNFEWYSSEMIALARMGDLDNLFPGVHIVNFMTLYPKHGDAEIEVQAAKLATVFQGAVHVKSAEGARRLFFTRAMEGSGFADVVVPLLLGGLIIFSSLMGSIVDREREIFTYSALGLSPPNVGALFFAESAVYSVIGGMGGYLLSQLVGKTLNTLGRLGLMTPPEMNFSSLTSVATILIVMGVVMLSTIYPALTASRSANPGVARRWKMPTPQGDLLKFVFPFTVSEVDFTGILSFIREHFSNHSDATLGSFSARNVSLFRLRGAKGGEDAIGIEADISLAPFDLGIFQKFRMYSSEFEIKGIDEVVVELRRVGGTPGAWQRSNRTFAAELRQQFLLWRSLPVETVEHYRQETATTLSASRTED